VHLQPVEFECLRHGLGLGKHDRGVLPIMWCTIRMRLSDKHSGARTASNADVLYRTALSELVAEASFCSCWRDISNVDEAEFTLLHALSELIEPKSFLDHSLLLLV